MAALARRAALLACLLAAACGEDDGPRCTPSADPPPPPKGAPPAETFAKIGHFIVIYLENRSFDHLFGEFPGAEGLAQAQGAPPQVDRNGVRYQTLPFARGEADELFPPNLPNGPFLLDPFVGLDEPLPDLVHRFYQQQRQIDGGRMDRFVAESDARGLTMGYHHTAALPLAALAAEFTLCDHFFHSAFGGSFLNHQYLIAARAPVWNDAPPSLVARLRADGQLTRDGTVTANGCRVVNTAFSAQGPHPAGASGPRVPAQTAPTIGDRLTAKGITWAWYAGGWNDAVAGRGDPSFQYHHQPFAYFAAYAEGTAARREHLKDEDVFFAALLDGSLPAVSFIKPFGPLNEHPGYSTVQDGEEHARALVEAVMASPLWSDSAIVITYDENGGLWDHVAPPAGDAFGPGVRVPALVISPYARRGFVDKTVYETASLLSTLEHRFDLEPLTARDAQALDLAAAFDFTQSP